MIKVIQGDITKIGVDAVVNAANTSLLGGGGVDGAIHRVGGTEILEACMKIRARQGGCGVGEAVITNAGKLPAKFVIHTVGPVWQGGNNQEDMLLTNAYRNSLKLATENNIQTIAFPNISTGIYCFPKKRAAEIALKTVTDYLNQQTIIREVVFVCFDKENFDIYVSLISTSNADYNLERFVEAQAYNYVDAFNEISKGRKTSHWMWYIFPQIMSLGFSEMSKKYAIQNLQEAEIYLSHEILGTRLVAICEALLKVEGKTAYEIFGNPDTIKLKSCMTLFSLASNATPIFKEVLERYFQGERCSKTLKILGTK
jgi:O-acetyl-ADP-ribose deacetylase